MCPSSSLWIQKKNTQHTKLRTSTDARDGLVTGCVPTAVPSVTDKDPSKSHIGHGQRMEHGFHRVWSLDFNPEKSVLKIPDVFWRHLDSGFLLTFHRVDKCPWWANFPDSTTKTTEGRICVQGSPNQKILSLYIYLLFAIHCNPFDGGTSTLCIGSMISICNYGSWPLPPVFPFLPPLNALIRIIATVRNVRNRR